VQATGPVADGAQATALGEQVARQLQAAVRASTSQGR